MECSGVACWTLPDVTRVTPISQFMSGCFCGEKLKFKVCSNDTRTITSEVTRLTAKKAAHLKKRKKLKNAKIEKRESLVGYMHENNINELLQKMVEFETF